jgi:hypothetical protein
MIVHLLAGTGLVIRNLSSWYRISALHLNHLALINPRLSHILPSTRPHLLILSNRDPASSRCSSHRWCQLLSLHLVERALGLVGRWAAWHLLVHLLRLIWHVHGWSSHLHLVHGYRTLSWRHLLHIRRVLLSGCLLLLG